MDSSDNEDALEISSKKLNEAKYSKILGDGSIDSSRLQEEDYEFTKRFIRAAFPDSTQVQRDLEQTLKRTFVLGRKGQQRSFPTPTVTSKKSKGAGKPKKKMSKSKLLKALGIIKDVKVPRRLKYNDFVEINSLWNAYVAELCGSDTDPNEIQAKLNRMDLHGAHIKVIEQKQQCPSFRDVEGIVVKETKETFMIVTPQDWRRIIPKKETVIDVKLENPSGTMRIAGNMFRTRPAERVCKKMKSFLDFVGKDTYKRKLIYSQFAP